MNTAGTLSNDTDNSGVMVNEEYEPTETEERVLGVLKEEQRVNPLLIREHTGLGKGTINTALANLRAAGWVRRVVRGLYDLVEDPRETGTTQTDKSQEGSQIEASKSPDVDVTPTPEPKETTIDAPDIDDSETLADADFPGTLDRDRCIKAAHAARELIREKGGATKKEIVQQVMPDYPLGYDVDGAFAKIEAGERYRGSWWRKVIKPGLESFSDVQKPKRGASKWKYRQNSE